MNKSIKLPPVGTKVFDIQFGWGEITSIVEGEFYSVYSCFENKGNPVGYAYTSNGKSENGSVPTLSLTEYDLVEGGFTPITKWDNPKPGDVGYFWMDEDEDSIFYGIITNMRQGTYRYQSLNSRYWKNFSKRVPDWYLEKMDKIINKQKP